jgi:Arc/MetJ family transcription regulator
MRLAGAFRCDAVAMAQTTIDINDELVAEVMRTYGLTTADEVVDLALRRLAGPPLSKDVLPDLDADPKEPKRLYFPHLPDLF